MDKQEEGECLNKMLFLHDDDFVPTVRVSCSGVETHEMILIDALVHSAGDAVSRLWKDEDGSGMYPPPSLHVSSFLFCCCPSCSLWAPFVHCVQDSLGPQTRSL